tara:strand:- start:2676 stop:3524 length:849 start_codon:yes stop_codon:yes gene_type:complete
MKKEGVGVSLVAYKISTNYLEKLSDSLDLCDLAYRVVVDNSPTTKSKKLFEKRNWTYIHKPENIGFGAAHNLVYNLHSNKSKYHLVINPDVYFHKNILLDLIEFMDFNKNAGAVSPAIYYPDGSFQRLQKLLPSPYGWLMRRFMKNSKSLKKYNYNFELRMSKEEAIFKYPYMSGCFMLLRNSIIDKIKLFDENIFMYGEDTDLSRKLWINGTPPYYYGKVKAFHVFGKGSHNSLKLLMIAIKSTIYYFNKWGWIDSQRRKINRECLKQFKKNSQTNNNNYI